MKLDKGRRGGIVSRSSWVDEWKGEYDQNALYVCMKFSKAVIKALYFF